MHEQRSTLEYTNLKKTNVDKRAKKRLRLAIEVNEMGVKIVEEIRQEKPSYLTLFLRKSPRVKIVESLVFVFYILALIVIVGYNHPSFKIYAVIGAIFILLIQPFFYQLLYRPLYILTNVDLRIRKGNHQTIIPLVQIEPAYDLRHFYKIKGKKTALAVSDEFLKTLEEQIAKAKR